jgi:hypothetical protein
MGSQMGSHRGFPPYHIVFIYCSQVPEEFAAFPRAGGSQKAAPPPHTLWLSTRRDENRKNQNCDFIGLFRAAHWEPWNHK